MTKRASWKRTVLGAATVATVAGLSVGGAALAESYSTAVPARSARVEAQRAELPRVTLPMTLRREATTYRVTGDECVGSVCAEGITVTTPAFDVSEVGGTTETPEVEVGTGELKVTVVDDGDSVRASVSYGAIGISYSVEPGDVLPRH